VRRITLPDVSSTVTPPNPLQCFAVTAPGLEEVTAGELHRLGLDGSALVTEPGGVSWSGDLRSLYRANLNLRTASRVLVRVAEFRAKAFWELERRTRPLPWEQWIGAGAEVAVRATCKKSKLYHSDAVAERIMEAIARRVRGVMPVAPRDDDEDEEHAAAPQLVIARLSRDILTLSVDSSGELLHRRGYRQAISKAPLRETLAAAMLLATEWRGESALLDPFCGSGTIPIEAALIARSIAPGLLRGGYSSFACLRWPSADMRLWDAVVAEARAAVRPVASVPIRASDRDAGAVSASHANAERAGVAADIVFEQQPISSVTAPAERGWLVSNPPYGLRVGDDVAVRDLWARLGQVVRERFGHWHVALLTPDAGLERQAGLPFEERLQTRNGGIPVRLVST
jgi:putative N6-adenine-specific DNA methylase